MCYVHIKGLLIQEIKIIVRTRSIFDYHHPSLSQTLSQTHLQTINYNQDFSHSDSTNKNHCQFSNFTIGKIDTSYLLPIIGCLMRLERIISDPQTDVLTDWNYKHHNCYIFLYVKELLSENYTTKFTSSFYQKTTLTYNNIQ